jgi:hypothetical protein
VFESMREREREKRREKIDGVERERELEEGGRGREGG